MSKLKDASRYLSLADALATLKHELVTADVRARAEGTDVLEFREAEITLAIEFQPGIEAGFNLGVFAVKASGGAKGTHSVTVRYSRRAGAPALVAAVADGKPVEKLPARRRTPAARRKMPRKAT
jgi:hypothetical protein